MSIHFIKLLEFCSVNDRKCIISTDAQEIFRNCKFVFPALQTSLKCDSPFKQALIILELSQKKRIIFYGVKLFSFNIQKLNDPGEKDTS